MFQVPLPACSLLRRTCPTQQQWPLLTKYIRRRSIQTRVIGAACREHLTPATSPSRVELLANNRGSSSGAAAVFACCCRVEQRVRGFAAAVAVSGGLLLGLAAAMASTEATCAAQEEIAALGTSGCSSEVTSERTELRRVALEYLTASMLANEAARADCGEEGVSSGSSSALKHDDDKLPPNLFDLDKILAKTPLLRTDNAFHDTLNSDATISCPYVLNRPGQVGEGIEAVVRFGKSTCGHPKTVHGGVTALTFDNLLGMALFLRGTGPVFTAFLKVDYKAPLPSRTTTVLDVTVDRQEGRKLFVTGRLNSLDGKVHYASAEALFVKPREKPSSRTE